MRLSELQAALVEEGQQHRAAQHKELQRTGSEKLKSAKRKSLTQNVDVRSPGPDE